MADKEQLKSRHLYDISHKQHFHLFFGRGISVAAFLIPTLFLSVSSYWTGIGMAEHRMEILR